MTYGKNSFLLLSSGIALSGQDLLGFSKNEISWKFSCSSILTETVHFYFFFSISWSTRPTTVATDSDYYFLHMLSVRPYVRTSQIFKIERKSLTAGTVGLAVWIIDDPCLVFLSFFLIFSPRYCFTCFRTCTI